MMDASRVVLMIWCSIFILFTLIATIFAFYSIRKSADKCNKFNSYSITAILLYLVTLILNGFVVYFRLQNDWSLGLILKLLAGIVWSFAQILTYILFIFRLQTAFNGTRYQSSNTTYNVIILVVILFLFFRIVKLCVIYMQNKGLDRMNYMTPSDYDYTKAALNFVSEILDLIVSIPLVYLFIKKLMLITVNVKDNDTMSQLLNVMVKYCVLSVTAIISTQLLVLYWFSANIYGVISQNYEMQSILIDFEQFLWSIEIFINVMCIFFYLDNCDIYYDTLCHGVHSWCKLWFSRHTKKKIKQKQSLELNQYLLSE